MGYFGGTLSSLAVFPMTPRLFWTPTSGDLSLLPPDHGSDSSGLLRQKEGWGKGAGGPSISPEKPISLWFRAGNRVKDETILEDYLEFPCIWPRASQVCPWDLPVTSHRAIPTSEQDCECQNLLKWRINKTAPVWCSAENRSRVRSFLWGVSPSGGNF